MQNNIKKEILVVTILFVAVICIMSYSMIKKFEIYDFIYSVMFISFYVRYLKLKKKQKDYI